MKKENLKNLEDSLENLELNNRLGYLKSDYYELVRLELVSKIEDLKEEQSEKLAELKVKYKSKLRLLTFYKNERKNNLNQLLIDSLKKELVGIEREIADQMKRI